LDYPDQVIYCQEWQSIVKAIEDIDGNSGDQP
jgi:hypothetical protein